MIPSDLKSLYSRFLKGHEGKLHFSAHSHHFWPDVTRDAHMEYWDDCARSSDHKWDKIFGEVIPKTQKHIARILNLKVSDQVVFAPNTHELTSRLLSLYMEKPSLKILTTESEFHSWKRQVLRMSELPHVNVTFVSTESLLEKKEDFLSSLKTELKKKPDLFYISQVFFDSGLALSIEELKDLQKACAPETMMVVDGYHGFAAIPTDLSELEGKIFYLAGGYKYAQAGEGVGFMVVPKGEYRPVNTGWFAEFGELSKPKGSEVGYRQDALAFLGATQDSSGLYRFNSVWDLFSKIKLEVPDIHKLVFKQQEAFIEALPPSFLKVWGLKPLFQKELKLHGHFLTFHAQSEEKARELQERLSELGVLIDRRGARLRFGFGLYQDFQDLEELMLRLGKLA